MGKSSFKRILGVTFALFFLLLNYSPYVQGIKSIPNRIQLFEGDTKTLNFRIPLPIKIAVSYTHLDVYKRQVNLILGERADRDLIQTGKNFALVEAIFDIRKQAAIGDFLGCLLYTSSLNLKLAEKR